jgi:hypothetical protein
MHYPKKIQSQEIPAYDFLCDLFGQSPTYEPDGEKGPDFLVSGNLAVETTQLMQSFFNNGNLYNIDANYKRIYDTLSGILRTYDNNYFGETYFVNFTYSAEIPRITPNKNRIHKALDEFLQNDNRGFFTFSIADKVEFSIFPGSPSPGKVFRIGVSDCVEQGGNPEIIYCFDINRCIEIKNQKLSAWDKSYPLIWLILVDNIGIWDRQINKNLITSNTSDLGEFSRVLLINWERELMFQIKRA